jgi:hypothetical protein
MKISNPVGVVIEIDGSEYRLNRPKLGAVKMFESEMAAATAAGTGITTVFMDHVVRCGLPIEVVETLDSDQLLEVFQVLQPAKKNS